MLYDKRWDVQVDPLTRQSLVAWLETKRPQAQYDYNDCDGKCLYGQYMAFHGVGWDESGAASSRDSGQARSDFCMYVYDLIANPRPWTFGAALKRASGAPEFNPQ